MKKSLILILLLSTITISKADSWTQKNSFVGIGRVSAVSFSIGNKGYVGCGFNYATNSDLIDFWEYDQTTNSWTQMADLPGTGKEGAVGFTINGKGYVGTGYSADSMNFFEYNPSMNTWTVKANFPGARRAWATGFSIGNKGYIGCGYQQINNDFYLRDFWVWDQTTNIWTEIDSLPGSQRYGAVGFSINGKGYVSTGDFYNTYLNDTWEYNPLLNIWTQMANFPGIGRAFAIGFAICNKGYLGGGLNQIMMDDFYLFDPILNQWIQKVNAPNPLRKIQVSLAINNKGYIGLGYDSVYQNSFTDLLEYTPDSVCTTEIQELSPHSLSLDISPNPFHDKATLTIQGGSKNTLLNIYDINGQKVRSISTDNRQEIIISRDNLASGIYFYELQAVGITNPNQHAILSSGKMVVE